MPDPAPSKKKRKGKAPGDAIDSTKLGPAFIHAAMIDSLPRWRFWRGTWLWWNAGAYRTIQPAEIRARVVEFPCAATVGSRRPTP